MDRRSFLKWLGKGSAAVVVVPATALSLVERYVPKPAPTTVGVDVYVSDFGTLKIIPNRFSRDRDAFFMADEEKLKNLLEQNWIAAVHSKAIVQDPDGGYHIEGTTTALHALT